MKKRIAIQLFGHLRTFDKTYKSLFDKVISPNIKDGYVVDIFIHTWDEKEHSDINFSNPRGEIVRDKVLKNSDLDLVNQVYSPKSIIIEKQDQIKEKVYLDKAGNKRSTKTFCNLSKTFYGSNQLRLKYEKEKGFKYDWVIVTRPDIEFLKEFRISYFTKAYQEWDIPIPENGLFYGCSSYHWNEDWYPIEIEELITCNDLIIFGKPKNMNKAMNLYPLWERVFQKDQIFTIEKMFRDFWFKQGLKPLGIKFRPGKEFIIKRLPYINSKVNFKNRLIERLLIISLFFIKLLPYFIAEKLIKKEGLFFRGLRKIRKIIRRN